MSLPRQCVIVFVLGFMIDLVQTLHINACSDRKVVLGSVTVIGIYLLGFLAHHWFTENKSSWRRWWITVAGALGAGLGTALVLLYA